MSKGVRVFHLPMSVTLVVPRSCQSRKEVHFTASCTILSILRSHDLDKMRIQVNIDVWNYKAIIMEHYQRG